MVLAYPLLILSVYRRDRSLLIGTLLLVVMNPLAFSPPEDDSAWSTRVVLGEQVWLTQRIRSSMRDLLLVTLALPVYVYTLRSAVKQQPIKTALSTVTSLVAMFFFFDRMTQLYERNTAQRTQDLLCNQQ